ncbi:nuclease PIN [Skermanella stibiiresistens SB22]|uniref:Nuclease PIN n=1 Tax=Skermanella stibiiresistens SB22 TaxID=1385369 RepID=W9GYW3_9PROT|nr:Fe2+-dependent dioxygenase [Skermanella stibiiresistens]EWY36653.1 nuclease PIN [Skermanella stibiiresistens SB22]
MILCIAQVLPPELLADVTRHLTDARFVDGARTAGWHARLVKRNEQLSPSDAAYADVIRRVNAAIEEHPLFQVAARPKAVRPVMISRYTAGMEYGTHVDDAMMGGVRTDISFTLFLSDPDSYDGGDLVMEGTGGEQSYKLDPGSMILYPSGALHRVDPVTRGARVAAVGWAQSLVRDAAKREILFDLDTARRAIFQSHGKTAEFDLISKSTANLLRHWAEA